MIRRSWATAAAAAVAIAAGGAVWWFAAKPPRIDPTDASQVAAGKALYRAHCASCHGANLEGQPDWRARLPSGRLPAPPHDASGHTWHHPDAVLLEIVREGPAFYAALGVQTDMPAFGRQLSEDDMAAVIAYIKSTWPAEIQARQAQTSH
jgi:mono/diheme cytochrome c family protein